jgi:hypothetical protein
MVVSTYQAASGAGAAAMAVRAQAAAVACVAGCMRSELTSHLFARAQELEQQTREVLAGQPVTKNIFKQQARCFSGAASVALRCAARRTRSGGASVRARMTLHLLCLDI